MASELIGRCACPECGFKAAHVKIKTDKEGAYPYRHCPDCGAQYFTRNKQQADNLKAQIRSGSEPAASVPASAAAPFAAAKVDPPPEPKPAPKKKSLLASILEDE